MRSAVKTIVLLQREKFGDKAEANSLNVCATDGIRLVAIRARNHDTEQPPSLYWSTKAGVTLNRKYPGLPTAEDGRVGQNPAAHKRPEEHGSHVIVASEPSTFQKREWEVIEKNCCLMVFKDGKVVHEKLEYPKEWNAPAASTVGDGGAEG